jgi:hypothetical protein
MKSWDIRQGAVLKREIPILDAFQVYIADGAKSNTSVVRPVIITFKDLCHLCGKWLLIECCPLTLAGKIKKLSQVIGWM